MLNPITIVIFTLNEEARLKLLLDDLSHQSYREFEVIVVDSNSDDGILEVAQSFQQDLPELTVHRMQERGVSVGRNTGAKLAKYERLLFLNADVRLPHDFLGRTIRELEASGLEVAGTYLGGNNLPVLHKLGYAAFNTGFFVTQYFFPTAVGACIFSTRRAHRQIGGFDETITLCEDCDYVNRASKTWRFRFLPITFGFNSRRLQQYGWLKTGLAYLKANIHRFFVGEIRSQEVEYPFGHYKQQH